MTEPDAEQVLGTWGSGTRASDATRANDIVMKSSGPWTPSVLALLRHLEAVGFAGAPRVVGEGYAADGRMTVSFVPGESPHPHAWADDKIGRVGVLLRDLHDATSSFPVPPDTRWQSTWLHEVQTSDDIVLGHGDAAPWNIIGRHGSADALIDWEYAGPIDRLTELAYAAWLNAQLHDDDIAERQGLPDAATRARHAHAILDAYGLPTGRRADLVDRMIELAIHAARAEAISAKVTPESRRAVDADGYPVLWAITWRARSASWMIRNRALLLRPRS